MQTSSVNSIVRQLDSASLRAAAPRPAANGQLGTSAAAPAPQFAAINAVAAGRAHTAQPASLIASGPRTAGTKEDQPGPLASLLSDWGKSGSPWDLNSDGTVNVQDMLTLLEKMSGAQAPQPLPAPAPQAAPKLQGSIGSQVDQPDPLKALLADWGKSGSAWDLDADGTVDVRDMLALLERMSGQAPQTLPAPQPLPHPQPGPMPGAEPADSNIAEKPDEQPDALTALKSDWGKSGSPWDLNGDGTVNVQDMLALLERMSTKKVEGSGTASAAGTPAPTTDAVETPAPPSTPPTRLESLMADWGKSGSPWDLNRDGTVNVRDLLTLLSQMSDRGVGVPGGNDPRLLNSKLMHRLHAAYNHARQGDWAPVKRALSVVG